MYRLDEMARRIVLGVVYGWCSGDGDGDGDVLAATDCRGQGSSIEDVACTYVSPCRARGVSTTGLRGSSGRKVQRAAVDMIALVRRHACSLAPSCGLPQGAVSMGP